MHYFSLRMFHSSCFILQILVPVLDLFKYYLALIKTVVTDTIRFICHPQTMAGDKVQVNSDIQIRLQGLLDVNITDFQDNECPSMLHGFESSRHLILSDMYILNQETAFLQVCFSFDSLPPCMPNVSLKSDNNTKKGLLNQLGAGGDLFWKVFKKQTMFQRCFGKNILSRKYTVSIYSLPIYLPTYYTHTRAPPHYQLPMPQWEVNFTTDKPILTQCYYLKFIVYIRVHLVLYILLVWTNT